MLNHHGKQRPSGLELLPDPVAAEHAVQNLVEVEVVQRHPRFLQIVVLRLCPQLPYPDEHSLLWFFVPRAAQLPCTSRNPQLRSDAK